jgi:hypothetical protein
MSRAGIFTVQHNEDFFLPMWIKYYSQHFEAKDIHIVAHNCTELVDDVLKRAISDGINVEYVETDEIFNHDWLNSVVHSKQQELLNKYEYVVFTDCDEFIVPEKQTLKQFIENCTEDAYRCTGFNVAGREMKVDGAFNKTLISKIQLYYEYGYHTCTPEFPVNKSLKLYHMHFLDYNQALNRNIRLANQKWDQQAIANGWSTQNRLVLEEDFYNHFSNVMKDSIPLDEDAISILMDIYTELPDE